MKHPHTDNEQKSEKPYDIRERSMLTGYLNEKDDPAIEESTELVKIVATIIRNSERNEAQRTLTNKERR